MECALGCVCVCVIYDFYSIILDLFTLMLVPAQLSVCVLTWASSSHLVSLHMALYPDLRLDLNQMALQTEDSFRKEADMVILGKSRSQGT